VARTPVKVLLTASPLPMDTSPIHQEPPSRLATLVRPPIPTIAHAKIAERALTRKDATTPCSPRRAQPRMNIVLSTEDSTVSSALQASRAMDILLLPAPVALEQDTAAELALRLAPPPSASGLSPKDSPSSLALPTPSVMQLARPHALSVLRTRVVPDLLMLIALRFRLPLLACLIASSL